MIWLEVKNVGETGAPEKIRTNESAFGGRMALIKLMVTGHYRDPLKKLTKSRPKLPRLDFKGRYEHYTPHGYMDSTFACFTPGVSASAPGIIFRRLYLYGFLR